MNVSMHYRLQTNTRFRAGLGGLLLAAFLSMTAGAAPPVKVLFLGDRGHHEPATRFAWVKDRLAQAGIAATYTENLADLNPGTLAQYDVLSVYANIAAISPEQERAVMDFVSAGGGFAPLHCASACFGNSKAMIALMGGRFARHKTGVFAPIIVNRMHPVMRGFKGYETWDETYVHDQHNEKGRTILAIRDENGVKEPWTWVRDQGKGRVFYTASGHDARTWTNAAFQELVVRGIAWTAGGKGESILASLAGDTAKMKNRTPLRYEPRPTVQNYEKRDPYPLYQFPLSPKDSMDYTHTEEGFDLVLFAAEPDVVKPLAFTWDHRGRLWVIESVDYPSVFTEQGQGHDRIKICEDTDGDGKADRFTVFADGLNIPTGLTFANGGLIVCQAPVFLFLKDTNGDDKADVREVIMDGWSKGDTHAGPSNLKWGFDNWLYGCVGYSGFGGEVGGQKLDFRMGPFRFSRDYRRMEFLGQYNNNTWGFAFNEAGELFGSTANNAHHFYTPIPIPYFKAVKGLDKDEAAQRSVKIDAHYAAHPLTDKIRQVDVFGGYTSASGENIYTARDYPERYWNRCALVTEPTVHLIHQGFLKRDGSGWTEDGDGMNLVASEEEWFAPVHAEVGPDGAVWFADWYNFIIQHNPTPKKEHGGFDTTTGAGGAHVNPLRDTKHGRIYSIRWRNAAKKPRFTLDPANGPQLVAALANDNLFWRLTAQRLLVERGQTDVVPALIQLAGDQGVDKAGINGGVIHALWTLHGLKQLDGSNDKALAAAVAALKHPSPAVRRNAAQMLPATVASAQVLLASGLLADPDTNVRLAAFLAAASLPADYALGERLYEQSRLPEVVGDKYLPLALRIAAARHAHGYLEAGIRAGAKLDAPAADALPAGAANLFPNPGFEQGAGDRPDGWVTHVWGGESTFNWVGGGRNGGKCVQVVSAKGGDTSWSIVVPCKPRHRYRLGGWTKCQDLKGARGSQFNVHNTDARTEAITGTKDWTFLSVDFDSRDNTELEINCLFGGWGKATGAAWFDDVALVELGVSASSTVAADGAAERIVARNAGHELPLSDQLHLLAQLSAADQGLAAAILDGLAAAWAEQPPPKTPTGNAHELLKLLAPSLSENNQRRLAVIAEAWGVREGLPGLAGVAPVKAAAKPVQPLSEADQKRFDSGKARYMTLCVACHQPNGMGLPAVAPPLAGSEWVTGPESRLIRMTLHGVKGPIVAAGVEFNLVMPPWKDLLDDNAVAEVLTYVRHEWGNDAKPVSAGTVKKVRAEEKARTEPWTAEELLKIK